MENIFAMKILVMRPNTFVGLASPWESWSSLLSRHLISLGTDTRLELVISVGIFLSSGFLRITI
jgi:hypothetical protein